MSTYYGVKGQKVQGISSDPTNLTTGQIWYNSSTQVIRVRTVLGSNAWATGNSLNVLRKRNSGAGTITAAVAFGGEGPTNPTPGPSGHLSSTELYNGSGWTTSAEMSMGRNSLGGAGTQTAALAFGGQGTDPSPPSITNLTEKFNGSSWTNTPTLNTGKFNQGSAGSSTSALSFGGSNPDVANANKKTEKWNGSSWSSSGDMNTGRTDITGAGATNSEAMAIGGSPRNGLVELFNGSSWTSTTNELTSTQGNKGVGTDSSALIFGGQTPSAPSGSGNTQIWLASGGSVSTTIPTT